MMRINAAFKDMIDLALFRQRQLDEKEFDKVMKECEYDLSEVSVPFVKDLLNNNQPENCKFLAYRCGYVDDAGCSLIIQRHLTDEEKQKEIKDCQRNLGHAKQMLLKWMENPDYNGQILTYLEHHNINIDGVK